MHAQGVTMYNPLTNAAHDPSASLEELMSLQERTTVPLSAATPAAVPAATRPAAPAYTPASAPSAPAAWAPPAINHVNGPSQQQREQFQLQQQQQIQLQQQQQQQRFMYQQPQPQAPALPPQHAWPAQQPQPQAATIIVHQGAGNQYTIATSDGSALPESLLRALAQQAAPQQYSQQLPPAHAMSVAVGAPYTHPHPHAAPAPSFVGHPFQPQQATVPSVGVIGGALRTAVPSCAGPQWGAFE